MNGEGSDRRSSGSGFVGFCARLSQIYMLTRGLWFMSLGGCACAYVWRTDVDLRVSEAPAPDGTSSVDNETSV